MSYQQRNYTRVLAVTGAAVVLTLHVLACTGPADNTDAMPQPSVAKSNIQVVNTPAVQHSSSPVHKCYWKRMPLDIQDAIWPTATVQPVEEESHEEPVIVTLTDVEDLQANYDLLKRVIVSEAGNQGMKGMRAVAQVIYDRAYRSKHDWNQDEGLSGVLTMRNQFASPYPWDLDDFEPTVSEAIDAVFIQGNLVFDEIVTYFYNPAGSTEAGIKFMQAQKYVDTIKDHEFRTGWDEND